VSIEIGGSQCTFRAETVSAHGERPHFEEKERRGLSASLKSGRSCGISSSSSDNPAEDDSDINEANEAIRS
jgi:hypothetical protein